MFIKQIPGQPDYKIHRNGFVISYKKSTPVILRPCVNENGYLIVALCQNNKHKTYLVHRLVANAFLKNPCNLPQINHKDCNKTNDCVSNLEWCDGKTNVRHAIDNGHFHHVTGYKRASKLTEKEVEDIRLKFKPYSYTKKMLAEEYNVSQATIAGVLYYGTKGS